MCIVFVILGMLVFCVVGRWNLVYVGGGIVIVFSFISGVVGYLVIILGWCVLDIFFVFCLDVVWLMPQNCGDLV